MALKIFNYEVLDTEIHVTYPFFYLHGYCTETTTVCYFANKTTCIGTQWSVVDGEFKVFVMLQPGENELFLSLGERSGEKVGCWSVIYTKPTVNRFVLPVYIVCSNSDGSFVTPNRGDANSVDEAVKKINFNVKLMQTFFAESLREHGYSRKTFRASDVFVFRSELDFNETLKMNQDALYEYFHEEVSMKLGFPHTKYLCFMSCTRFNPPAGDRSKPYVTGHAALGGGSMALFGTGSLHTWASNFEELNACFNDGRTIDRSCMFDDSCGRGTYWANYSTSLGAAIHELGHCFDLAHTPHGIMSRGHDDMNCFYVVNRQNGKEAVRQGHSNYKYKGAHWHRASAVLLNYHKWFNLYPPDEQESTPCFNINPTVLGPVGNCGPSAQIDQVNFNSKTWLSENNLVLCDVILYWLDYLNGVQFSGVKMNSHGRCEADKIHSPIYGSESGHVTVLPVESNERMESIKIRSGAWIDGLQITSSLKSSCWLGGLGGDVTVFEIPIDKRVEGFVGSAGRFVGSFGVLLNSDGETSQNTPPWMFTSCNGIRLVELRDESGEIREFYEYVCEPAPRAVYIPRENKEVVSGSVIDDRGKVLSFSLKNKT